MTAAEQRWKQSKAIIANACLMLRHGRETGFAFNWGLSEPASADCYVLLRDATKMFCAAVSEHFGEPADHRWSPVLPELLLTYPEKWDETLALVERKDFHELSHFQYTAA
jgi:hypothetical protein